MVEAANRKNCLHLVASASAEVISRCRKHFEAGDTLVFLGDGVMLLASGSGDSSWPPDGSLFSSEDVDARGLLPVARREGRALMEDSGFATLLRRHDHCLTWK